MSVRIAEIKNSTDLSNEAKQLAELTEMEAICIQVDRPVLKRNKQNRSMMRYLSSKMSSKGGDLTKGRQEYHGGVEQQQQEESENVSPKNSSRKNSQNCLDCVEENQGKMDYE